jgi:hypothetical protein
MYEAKMMISDSEENEVAVVSVAEEYETSLYKVFRCVRCKRIVALAMNDER